MSLTAIAETQTYDVLLEEQPDGTHQASILGWTDCHAIGPTAAEAIEKVQILLNDRIAKSKIIQIKVNSNHSVAHYHPWMQFAARLRDNPLLDEIEQSIVADRLVLDQTLDHEVEA